MRQWMILFKKEVRESIRNFKWIWIPVVFILLGLTQPVVSYYLPDLLEQFGGLPEGAAAAFPVPTGSQVLAETLGQFSQIGLLVLVLAFMGAVAGERNNGTNIMILVKPVSYASYISAKWAHMVLLALVSFAAGFIFSVYYTFLLIESVPAAHIIQGALVYGLWLTFVMTVVLTLSTIIKSPAAVAFLTFGVTITLSLTSSLLPEIMTWSPGMLSSHSHSFFMNGTGNEGFWLSLMCTILLIAVMLTLAIYVFRKKEMAVHTT
ncbi:ABC transporter permease [Evansella sp. LMS18]|jgi:ABC-2 type transport system permease protein|uniref:ABC transporter permease n=1 Tax=Evansella sp. LMS18 TaxID=2924033 RepID=UPI0020D07B73|nr:ABC transporter permease subunit [Evansella sp. LMS18]UTR11588.1 ABC transporter permease [Evansella sp. LMS18]